MLTSRLVTALGVWFHPRTFERLPILFPHVVRDESARGRRAGKEEWASPNASGYLRDDNSMIKEAVKALPFESMRPLYAGRRIGRAKGWVAAHVWHVRLDDQRSSRDPLTNSFLPNLVWLPKDLAQLSDRPGSFVQRYLQALSHKIYGHIQHPEPLAGLVREAWSKLEVPDIPEQGLPGGDKLTFFTHDEGWITGAIERIVAVRDALDAVANRAEVPSSLRPTRYRKGLARLSAEATTGLRALLSRYIEGITDVPRP